MISHAALCLFLHTLLVVRSDKYTRRSKNYSYVKTEKVTQKLQVFFFSSKKNWEMKVYEWKILVDNFSCCSLPIIRYSIDGWRARLVFTSACIHVKNSHIKPPKIHSENKTDFKTPCNKIISSKDDKVERESINEYFPNCDSPIMSDSFCSREGKPF